MFGAVWSSGYTECSFPFGAQLIQGPKYGSGVIGVDFLVPWERASLVRVSWEDLEQGERVPPMV